MLYKKQLFDGDLEGISCICAWIANFSAYIPNDLKWNWVKSRKKIWSCHSLILIIPCLGYPSFNILFQIYNFHPHTWWTRYFRVVEFAWICLFQVGSSTPIHIQTRWFQRCWRPISGNFGPLKHVFFHGGPTKHSPHLLVKSAGGWYPRFLSVFQGTWLSWWVPQRARSRYWSLELTKQHIRIAYRRFWH